jgi:uncharacterized membrane protein
VRHLIQRVVAVLAVLIAAIVAWINLVNQTPWPLVLLRAGMAIAIVAAAGFIVGYVLMRTALRRHYEKWLAQSHRRAGAER